MGTVAAPRNVSGLLPESIQVAGPDPPPCLVATKIDPPIAASWLLPRKGLVDRLAHEDTKLCLICAPAGWGKTSLLAAWRDLEPRRRFAFVQLESGDDDVTTFWAYVVAALRDADLGTEHLDEFAERLRTPGVDPMRRVVPQLVNELHAIAEPVVFVLDDYYVLSGKPVHDSVLFLLDHLPPAVRVVISTRVDPPFPLSRLRASGQMTELRAAQLRLDEEETAQMLLNRFGLALDVRDVELLCRRTEGWPAGLQLAGLALKDEADHHAFVETFAGDDRNLADYLTGEVLDRLPDDRARFLTHTSILDRLSGPLCDAVADTDGSALLLDELEHDNLFLVSLDHQRRWYRYHHLFGEWLRHELQRTAPETVSELHSRASRWFDSENHLEGAISHAIAAGEQDRAGGIMDRYLADVAEVNWSSVFRWLDQLCDSVKEDHPMVAIAEVRSAFSMGNFLGGLRWLPVAEKALTGIDAETRGAAEAAVRLFTAFGELVAGDIDLARILFEEIAAEERPALSFHFAMAIGDAGTATFWTAGPLAAIPQLREAVVAQETASMADTGATALLAAAYAEIGDWHAAETTAVEALALPQPFEDYPYPFRMPAHYALGQALIAQDQPDRGLAEIREGLAQARAWVEPIFIAYGCLLLAEALDSYGEKRTLVREARQLIQDGRSRGRIGDLVAVAERRLSFRRPSQQTPGTVRVEPLTDRERDVLRWLHSELSQAEIAREMFVSYNTVKGHTKAIYRKLGVSSRAAAIETGDLLDVL